MATVGVKGLSTVAFHHLIDSVVQCSLVDSDIVRRQGRTYCRKHSRISTRRARRTAQPDTLSHTQNRMSDDAEPVAVLRGGQVARPL